MLLVNGTQKSRSTYKVDTQSPARPAHQEEKPPLVPSTAYVVPSTEYWTSHLLSYTFMEGEKEVFCH